MPRVVRTALPDGFFHVTALGVNKTAIFLDDRDRLFFLELLLECVERFVWEMWAMCLMTTHYHLVLHSTRPNLSDGIQVLSGEHAARFNARYERTGHLFGGRFGSRVIDSDEYLAAACEYVWHNPVRAGLVTRPEDWPWSHLRYR
jgi:REP element-mobilizing transposase RayT